MEKQAEAPKQMERLALNEHYGLSLNAIRRVGELALQGAQGTEYQNHLRQLRAEFDSSVFEALSSDKEYGGDFKVTKFDEYQQKDGKVLSYDKKTPVTMLTKNGLISARERAASDKRFKSQATRSWWDHQNALAVDSMVRGKLPYNTRIVVSPLPEEAIEESGAKYWDEVGYISEQKVAYIQLYHASEDGEVLAGSLSVNGSDKQRWREIFAAHGVEIPEDEITDNWLAHPITGSMSREQAKQLALDIREEYDAGTTETMNKLDTVSILDQNKSVFDRVFNEVYTPIAKSLAKGSKTSIMQQVVDQFLAHSSNFSQEVKDSLFDLSSRDYFTGSDARLMHQLSVYAAVEALRTSVKRDNSGNYVVLPNTYISGSGVGSLHVMQMMAQYAAAGAAAGRTYSSCGAAINISDNPELLSGPQEAYGSQASNKTSNQDGTMRCVNCPECKTFHHEVKKDGGKYYCKNKNCKLAAPALKKTVQVKKTEPPKVVKKSKANKTSTHEYALAA